MPIPGAVRHADWHGERFIFPVIKELGKVANSTGRRSDWPSLATAIVLARGSPSPRMFRRSEARLASAIQISWSIMMRLWAARQVRPPRRGTWLEADENSGLLFQARDRMEA